MVIQNRFYGYIDENGVLRDSLFLPLSAIGILAGVAGLIFTAIWFYLRK